MAGQYQHARDGGRGPGISGPPAPPRPALMNNPAPSPAPRLTWLETEHKQAKEAAFRAAVAAHGAHVAATRAAAQNVLNLQNQLNAATAAQRQAGATSGSLTQSITTLSYSANDAAQAGKGDHR